MFQEVLWTSNYDSQCNGTIFSVSLMKKVLNKRALFILTFRSLPTTTFLIVRQINSNSEAAIINVFSLQQTNTTIFNNTALPKNPRVLPHGKCNKDFNARKVLQKLSEDTVRLNEKHKSILSSHSEKVGYVYIALRLSTPGLIPCLLSHISSL